MPHILSKIQIPLIKSMLRLFNSPRPSILRGGLFFCFIFLHNRHMNILQRIFTDYYEEIKYTLHHRASEMENIEKMINCGDPSFGGAMYGCPHCGNLKSVPFRYHSRLCPSCGNKYSMERTTSSKLATVYLSCPPPGGLFSIYQNANYGLSYKVKQNFEIHLSSSGFYFIQMNFMLTHKHHSSLLLTMLFISILVL